MLQGDDLTIQLFIAATAIVVLGVAVTQAGWTHKWFVRSLFLSAAILILCALLWKQIAEKLPHLAESMDAITKAPISWFVLLLVSIGLVFLLDFGARMGWLKSERSNGVTGIVGNNGHSSINHKLCLEGLQVDYTPNKKFVRVAFILRNSADITLKYEVQNVSIIVQGTTAQNPTFSSMGGFAQNGANTKFFYPLLPIVMKKGAAIGIAEIDYIYGPGDGKYLRVRHYQLQIMFGSKNFSYTLSKETEINKIPVTD